jgi:hypothetical protein
MVIASFSKTHAKGVNDLKQTSTSRPQIVILVGIIVVIALAVSISWYNTNRLTILHQSELQPALEKYYYQRYLQYKQDYPKFFGSFNRIPDSFYVIVYQSKCSIIKAGNTNIKVSFGVSYYLLKKGSSDWEVTDWAPAVDPVTTDLVDKTLPIPFTCDGE